MKSKLLGCLSCICVAFHGAAQPVAGTSPKLPYYVALQYSQANYEIYYPSTPNYNSIYAPQLVVGWQLKPRLAAQVGFGFERTSYRQDPSYTGTTVAGVPIYGWSQEKTYMHSFPVLMRYSLVQYRKTRVQLDFLAGATVLYAKFRSEGAGYVGGQLVRQSSYGDQATQFYLAGGFGVRYLFRPRIEGVFEAIWSRNTKEVPSVVHLNVSGNSLGITKAYSLGLRYRFNLRRQAAPEALAP